MTAPLRITSGRAALAAEIVGHGAPVVFLHANVADRRMWRAQLDAVGATHKAIAYDRRGFGETRAEKEDHSCVTDLMAVLAATAEGKPAILVGCSLGGRVVIDAAVRHPAAVRGVVLVAPGVAGAPDPVYPPDIAALLAQSKSVEQGGDLDRINAMKARIWLDGVLSREGRVAGPARELFLDMNGIALRSPPVGSDIDVTLTYHRLGDIAVPALVIWGSFDFPHIQERSRKIVTMMPKAVGQELTGTAHLPSLDRPDDVARLITDFIARLP